MFTPYPMQRYQNQQNGYEYNSEYLSYTPTPQGGATRTCAPPAYQQPQPAPNPFLPAAIQPAPVASFSQKQNNRRKKRGLSLPAAALVPQPLGNVALAPQVLPPPPQNLSQNVEPPSGHKWVLVSDGAQATIPPAPTPDLEPVETSVEMKTAQAAVNKMELIIESALIYLLEPRQRYFLSKIRILEAYVPVRKIKVLA